MIKIAVYGKGGIGKSTVTSHLAAAFATLGNSTINLLGGQPLRPVMNFLREEDEDPDTLEEISRVGFGGILCIETGGPTPGLGCAGRGIIATFQLLEDLRLFETWKPDVVLYDVLGDVVCGGFAAPIREGYAEECIAFAKAAARKGVLTVFRLWNKGGLETNNGALLSVLKSGYPGEWEKTRSGYRLADRTFIEFGEKFDWPDAHAQKHEGEMFCYALRDQVGILCDGTVVPCCLDAEGIMALGNIHGSDLEAVLSSEKARKIYDGFSSHRASEELCTRCGYAAVTKKYRVRDK